MKAKHFFIFLCLAVLILLAAFAGLRYGSVPLSAADIRDALLAVPRTERTRVILLSLRLPRVLAAILAGMGLATAGVLLQAVTDNDLCAPNVIGINAGAGLGTMLLLCLCPMWFALLPLAAFAGAMIATATVLTLASGRRASKMTLILAGVALSSLFNAGISLLTQLYPDVLSSYMAFSVGSLSGIYPDDLILPAILILLTFGAACLLSPRLNLLCLGEAMASSLGVHVKRLRMLTLVIASLLCAAVVSFAGLLGFVGLIVPHMARRLVGHDNRLLIPASALMGAVLVLISDLVGRVLLAPAELPVGILMSAIGAPFFLFLLLRRRKERDPV